MSDWGDSEINRLSEELRSGIEKSESFDPADADTAIPAQALRDVLLAPVEKETSASELWVRNATIVGDLSLEGARIVPRLRFENCVFSSEVNLKQAEVADLQFDRCELKAGIQADQIDVRWNLDFDDSIVLGEISLLDSVVGGALSLIRADVRGADLDGETIALECDRIQATTLVADGIRTRGVVRILGADISGQLSFNDSVLKAVPNSEGIARAIYGDGAKVAGGIFAEHADINGEIKVTSVTAGPLILTGMKLRNAVDNERAAGVLTADGARISGGMWCDGVEVTGELRLISAKIEGQLSLNGAQLSASDYPGARSLGAEDVEVTAGVFCEGLITRGEIVLADARIGSCFVLAHSRLDANRSRRSLNLTGAVIDELVLALGSVEGLVDLQQAEVRSLRDAHEGQYTGVLPSATLLDGFSYQSLREPLDAERRLEWVGSSQNDRFYPGVYSELAAAFRRIGRPADARLVSIAREHKAREELPQWSPRRFWSWLLYLTIGYGYRNWLAAIWLGLALAAGWLTFLIGEGSFAEVNSKAPAFDPALYTIDVTIPVLDAGQQSAWTPTGALVWVSLGLTVLGYALATAVIAAAAGLLNRDET